MSDKEIEMAQLKLQHEQEKAEKEKLEKIMAEQDDIQIDESPAVIKSSSLAEGSENMVGYEQLEEKQEEIERLNFLIQ